jgi:hypothetical protein
MIKKAIIPFISLLFLSYLSAQGFQFAQTVTVDGGQGNAYDLIFGFSPDATDGFNDGTDELAPPAPPPPAFDAALYTDQRYYTQIVAGLTEDIDAEHVWDLQLAYDTNNLINVTWDNTSWSDLGTFVLQDAFGGALGIDINMTTEDSLTLTDPNINTLKLIVTPNGTDGPFLSTGENYETSPAEFSLHGNYPNPFNPVTFISYEIPKESFVRISVYNLLGQKVENLVSNLHPAGYHNVMWNSMDMSGKSVSSGVYIYTITAGDYHSAKKMILIK